MRWVQAMGRPSPSSPASAAAVAAGCDGVEINAGQHSLVRQFLSGLTNHRDDVWGVDRWLFASEVIEAVRAAIGDRVVGLRLSCDELAPWAGITPALSPGCRMLTGEIVERARTAGVAVSFDF